MPSSASSFANSNCSSSSSSFSSYSGCSQSVPEITSTLALKSLVECISKLIELSCAGSSCTASSFSVLSDFSASTLSAFTFSVLSSAFLVSSPKSGSGIPVSKSISGASILGSSSSTTTSPVLLPVSMSALGIVNIAVLPKSSAVSEASFWTFSATSCSDGISSGWASSATWISSISGMLSAIFSISTSGSSSWLSITSNSDASWFSVVSTSSFSGSSGKSSTSSGISSKSGISTWDALFSSLSEVLSSTEVCSFSKGFSTSTLSSCHLSRVLTSFSSGFSSLDSFLVSLTFSIMLTALLTVSALRIPLACNWWSISSTSSTFNMSSFSSSDFITISISSSNSISTVSVVSSPKSSITGSSTLDTSSGLINLKSSSSSSGTFALTGASTFLSSFKGFSVFLGLTLKGLSFNLFFSLSVLATTSSFSASALSLESDSGLLTSSLIPGIFISSTSWGWVMLLTSIVAPSISS